MPFEVYKKKFIPPVMPLILSNPGSQDFIQEIHLDSDIFKIWVVFLVLRQFQHIYMGMIKHQQPHLYKLNDLIK